jgi:acyl carrier protein
MDGVEILVEVEDAFGIKLDDREVSRVVTVGDLCELVLSVILRARDDRFTRPQVEALVVRIIADHQAIPLERVTLTARLVEDLAID